MGTSAYRKGAFEIRGRCELGGVPTILPSKIGSRQAVTPLTQAWGGVQAQAGGCDWISGVYNKEKQDAEISLSKAYNLTQGHYAQLNEGGKKDVEREHAIAASWQEASIRIRKFNRNLANRLGLKSRFWREGAAWTDDQIKGARIGLDDVRREGAVVLRA